jgi:predicted permease
MDTLLRDVRFALRLLWRDRAFTVTAVATLALCLAANVAIYSLVRAVLLRPLPFPEPAALMQVHNAYPGAGVERADSGVPDYYDRLESVPAFAQLAMYRTNGLTIGGQGEGEPERITAMPATPSLFALLDVRAARGRTLLPADGELGQHHKVVLSDALWRRRFGGRDDVVGRSMRVNGVPHEIVGVLAPDFWFVDADVQLWTAAAFTAEERSDESRHSNNWQQIARLAPGATRDQAQAQIDALNARNLERFPHFREVLTNARFHTVVAPFHEDLVAPVRPALLLLWAGAAVVLLVGVLNVANLAAVRASGRQKELATRHALGAGLGRLSAQLVTESMVVAAVGGVLGLGLGLWALAAAASLGMIDLPAARVIGLDPGVLPFAAALVVAVGLGVGLLPVAAVRRVNLAQVVREEGRSGTASRAALLVRRALVGGQVAFTLVLLVGAGLLIASFERVLGIDPGFRPEGVLTGTVSLPASRYPDDAARRSAADRILERARALPGVQSAGVTNSLPLSGSYSDSVILAEGYQMQPGESLVSPSLVVASDGYFEAMGARLLAGRLFDGRDRDGAPRALVIDDRLARRFWPDGDAVGKRMYNPSNAEKIFELPPDDQMLTVVGVVAEMRLRGLVEDAGAARVGAYYFPNAQRPAATLSLAIRTAGDPLALADAVRREIAAVDPELPFYAVRSMAERVDLSLLPRRTPMALATAFGLVALLLAAIGLYGVLAHQVGQRRREIGIRLALGADRRTILLMVLRDGFAVVAIGAVAGLTGALVARRAVAAELYGVEGLDPLVVAVVVAVLAAVSAVACVVPARQAATVDPAEALQ